MRRKPHLDALLSELVTQTAPDLLALYGKGSAAALLVTAGDNPGQLRSEAAWAHLCGTAPIPALLGQGDPLPAQPRRCTAARRPNIAVGSQGLLPLRRDQRLIP